MENTEMRIWGLGGGKAVAALNLERQTRTYRRKANDALQEAGLSGEYWWAARNIDRYPYRGSKLMVTEAGRNAAKAALDDAGVEYEEVER